MNHSMPGKLNPAYKHGFAVRGKMFGEYHSWCNMRRRCYSSKNNRYQYYGARGITVCQEWRDSFEKFIADMGLRPSKDHSIDRIDTDGNYEPSNCKWSTRIEQAKTRSTTLNFNGKSLRQACLENGANYKAAWARMKAGTDPFIPLKRSKYNG